MLRLSRQRSWPRSSVFRSGDDFPSVVRFAPVAAVHPESLFLQSDNERPRGHCAAWPLWARELGAVPVIEQAAKFVITILKETSRARANCDIAGNLDVYVLGARALPKYINPQIARSSKCSRRTPPSNFSIVTLPVKR